MKILIGVLFILVSANTFSFGKAVSKVKSVRVDINGSGLVEFEKPIEHQPPECVSSYQSHFSFNTNTEGGKAIYSMVTVALASQKKIVAYGTNTCNEYPNDVESWSYGHIYR